MNLDKHITIEKFTDTVDASTQESMQTWEFLKETLARIDERKGSTSYFDEGRRFDSEKTFIVRWDHRIGYDCRIVYSDEYWVIDDIQEMGRAHFWKIMTHRDV